MNSERVAPPQVAVRLDVETIARLDACVPTLPASEHRRKGGASRSDVIRAALLGGGLAAVEARARQACHRGDASGWDVSAPLYSCASCPKGGQCATCAELDAASAAIREAFDADRAPTEAERARWEAACVAANRRPS